MPILCFLGNCGRFMWYVGGVAIEQPGQIPSPSVEQEDDRFTMVLFLGVAFVFLALFGVVMIDSLFFRKIAYPTELKMGKFMHQGLDYVHPDLHKSVESAIQAIEPGFNADQFFLRLELALPAIRHAWQCQDLVPIRHFVSDGIYERFSLRIQEQMDRGQRSVQKKTKIKETGFTAFHQGDIFETLTVQINASGYDFIADRKSGKYLSGDRRYKYFTEYWSFIRRRGAQLKNHHKGLMEGFCPNCHMEIKMNQSDQCPACRAVLRSGEYDWVLAEITQPDELKELTEDVPPSVKRYELIDSGFNFLHIEDRASVIFWRKVMSDRKATIQPLMKMASDTFCQAIPGRIEPGGPDKKDVLRTLQGRQRDLRRGIAERVSGLCFN